MQTGRHGTSQTTATACVAQLAYFRPRAYPAEVVLRSDVLALPGARNLGRIFWDADTPPGTRVEVRTRAGNLLDNVVH